VVNWFHYFLVLQVEALLLLSQQEERYYLESKTIQGLEFQIKDLNEKISQVAHFPDGRFTWFIKAAKLKSCWLFFLGCFVPHPVVTWTKIILPS
jgi:hypothetical protein